MKILPAIDLRHGKVVQLVGGDPEQVAVQAERTPGEQAAHWKAQGAKALHVVDLDAALGGANQWLHLSRILAIDLPVRFGGGVRTMLQVQKLLELGVAQVVLGTQGVRHPEWLREIAGLWPGRITLAVDALGRDVMVKGWTETTGLDVVELARGLDDAGLGGFLYTNVEKEGRLAGIDADVVQDLRDATTTPLTISGGITTMDDLQALADLGVDACVLGMAAYTGRIDVAEAVRRFEVDA